MIHTVYFSPTGSTRRYAEAAGRALQSVLPLQEVRHDWTLPKGRGSEVTCTAGDLFLFAFPVYGGRVPQLCRQELSRCHGEGTPAILLGVYGNRHYDDALLEASHILEKQEFSVIGAAALLAEHTITPLLAPHRPEADDLEEAAAFAKRAAAKLLAGNLEPPDIPGDFPYKPDMPPRPFHPETTESCLRCGRCAAVCPMGIIDRTDPFLVADGCIQCRACMKICPVHAKQFTAEPMLKLQAMLEANCQGRKENEYFL